MRRLLVLLFLLIAPAVSAETVVFLGSASDSQLFAAAFKDLKLPERIRFEHYCMAVDDPAAISAALRRADILIVNARAKAVREAAAGVDFSRTKLYALSSRLLPKEIPAREPPEIRAYRANSRPENFRNMVLWIVHKELDPSVRFAPPVSLPEVGITHPDAKKVFASFREFLRWSKSRKLYRQDAPMIALAVHSASINRQELALFRHITAECERLGMNVMIVYGDEVRVIRELLLGRDGKPRVDAVLALSFKFKAGLGEPLRRALNDLDVPVFNALRLYRQTTPEWEASQQGMNNFAVAFGFIAPETSGLIEPSLLIGSRQKPGADGRSVQIPEVFPEHIRHTVARLKKWADLRRKNNAEKKIALFLYNGAGGKMSIGASGLNVPRSIVRILGALAGQGYSTGGLEKMDETALTSELLRCARNVGSWAPGELDELIARGEPVILPFPKYEEWFAALPGSLRESVLAEWGPPGQSKMMAGRGGFVLPMLRRGGIVILPEPMRGWLDDPHKLLHSRTLPPPHQYLAVYLWLQHEFRADAMIHLGRHGSNEWLPGKQLGPRASDPVETVRGNIPEIYPYISDGIGEGIIAKRRARAVTIAHLTPFLKTPAADAGLNRIRDLVTACQTADPSVRPAREKALRAELQSSGLAARLKLDLNSPHWFAETEEYVEKRSRPAPFGLHAFGVSPSANEIRAMLDTIPAARRAEAEKLFRSSGEDELQSLLHALSGGFVPPGPSGDPVRRPEVLPSGRNFYSFDPDRIPTPASLKTGAELAEKLLASRKSKDGMLRSVAILLWAGESVRTDGVNEAMALALMGMTLRYDRTGRITGVVPIPGAQLRHPRINVVLTASGAYRDQFGSLLRLLDSARRQAAKLRDAENFIQGETSGIFFPAPGTYGTRISRLAGASGSWEDPRDLSDLYLRNMSHTLDREGNFTSDPSGLQTQVKQIDAVLQSRSSNVYGVTDIDEMFQYLGGLSSAVKQLSGRTPEAFISDLRRTDRSGLTPLKTFLAAELDSRIFNPEWIRSMMQEDYAGGKTLSRIADNIWGWQAVTPENISAADWSTMYDIYVRDRYRLGMKKFFEGNREWVFQSMTARMLEAVRKNYWTPELKVRQSLASEYARSVIRQGVACCDHTCNNPLLNQMVVNLISMPGVLSPELTMQFRTAVEKAGGANLADQIRQNRERYQQARAGLGKGKSGKSAARSESASRSSSPRPAEMVPVRGFKMEMKRPAEKTSVPSSGVKWTILLAVIALIGVFLLGARRKAE
ncbi:MAG: cobaltochelatase subunit CobN [Lentisphaeria bacterium]|nr:cobaltochelatase subunit CobN [Lentisphaeria bacterium]